MTYLNNLNGLSIGLIAAGFILVLNLFLFFLIPILVKTIITKMVKRKGEVN